MKSCVAEGTGCTLQGLKGKIRLNPSDPISVRPHLAGTEIIHTTTSHDFWGSSFLGSSSPVAGVESLFSEISLPIGKLFISLGKIVTIFVFKTQAGSRVYQKHARACLHANFGEHTLAILCTKKLRDMHQSSGEGPPKFWFRSRGAFCMWVAFRRCPKDKVSRCSGPLWQPGLQKKEKVSTQVILSCRCLLDCVLAWPHAD